MYMVGFDPLSIGTRGADTGTDVVFGSSTGCQNFSFQDGEHFINKLHLDQTRGA